MAHSASFHRASVRIARALAVGIASCSLFLAGCDSASSKSDKTVTEQLDDANLKMDGSVTDRSFAHTEIDSASKDTTASLPVQIRAKSMLADSELRIAQDITLKIQNNDVLIDRLAREIGLLGNDIEANNIRAGALAKLEPTELQAAVAQKQADVKGSEDKPDWYKTADAALPSLEANDKQSAALQTQISQLQDTIKSETAQRNQLIDQADKLTQQSYHEQKDKSVQLFTQGSNARKQAADITVKLDQDNVDLARAQADLALRTGHHESLSSAMKVFDDDSAYYSKDWAGTQAVIARLNADSREHFLGSDPVDLPKKDARTGDLTQNARTDNTISWKAAAIAVLAEENHNLRAEAEPHFNSAKSFYANAAELAQKFQTEIKEKQAKRTDSDTNPDAQAWDVVKYALDPTSYRVHEANAELQKAAFLARSAEEAKVRLAALAEIKPVVTTAQLTVPTKLDDSDGSIASQLKNALSSADEEFKEASDLLSNAAEGTGTPEQKNAAQVQLIFAQYSWAQLEMAMGDPQKAAEHMNYARNAVTAANTNGSLVPTLPPELVEPAGASPGATPGAVPAR
jgi:hypothetical protein